MQNGKRRSEIGKYGSSHRTILSHERRFGDPNRKVQHLTSIKDSSKPEDSDRYDTDPPTPSDLHRFNLNKREGFPPEKCLESRSCVLRLQIKSDCISNDCLGLRFVYSAEELGTTGNLVIALNGNRALTQSCSRKATWLLGNHQQDSVHLSFVCPMLTSTASSAHYWARDHPKTNCSGSRQFAFAGKPIQTRYSWDCDRSRLGTAPDCQRRTHSPKRNL
jgi:hypothetical protein